MLVSTDYPYIQVRVSVRGHSFSFRALLDTGFDGHVVLPESLAIQLGQPDSQIKAHLADGSGKIRPQYHGAVEIVGLGPVFMARLTLLGDECLLGQGIIRRLKVTFDHGSQVVIEP